MFTKDRYRFLKEGNLKSGLYRILSGIFIFVCVLSLVLPGAVYAVPVPQVDKALTPTAYRGPKRGYNPETGKVSFIGGGDPIKMQGVSNMKDMTPENHAMNIATIYGTEFGLKNPSRELKLLKSQKDNGGNDVVHYQQTYNGIPVIAGELVVNMNTTGELLSISGEVSSDLTLETNPSIQAQVAYETALSAAAAWHTVDASELTATSPKLWIFDESLLTTSRRSVELVWRMEVTAKDATQPIREMVLVNAQTGTISWHVNQVDTETAHSQTLQADLESKQVVPATVSSQVQYVDLVIDEARGKLYGADKMGNKVDVIDMADMSVTFSYLLASGALPNGIDLSLDGNELAVAQSGSSRVAFINLVNGTISEMPSALSGSSTKATDVIYGRLGVLYALSTRGLHVIDLTVTPHVEATTQYVSGDSFEERLGVVSLDKNTLYYVTGTCCSGDNRLYKFNISAGLSKPVQLGFTYLYKSGYKTNIRLSLADDGTLLTAWGSVYDASTLTLKAKNGQSLLPVIALPGRSFYAVAYDNPSSGDALYFFDEESSHKLSVLPTGTSGTPGAMAVTSAGNTLFVSSTGGMAKFEIGTTPPGVVVGLLASLHQYRDFAFDMARGVVYGTDASGQVDVIDQDTGTVVISYLLPNGSNPTEIELRLDGSELAIVLNALESILFLNAETGTEIARVTPKVNYESNLPSDIVYGRAGRLYSIGDSYIQVFDATAHTWISRSYYPSPLDLEITSDNKYLYSNSTYTSRDIYVFDAQTDVVTQLFESQQGTSAEKFDIVPDGSKVFTSGGQVWSRDIGEQIGTLDGAPGSLIEYIHGKDAVALAVGNIIKFISAHDYHLISTYTPAYSGSILEMEVAPDGSRLIANFSGGEILILDTSAILSVPPQIPVPSTIKYEDLVADSARGQLYGTDKAGNKVDIISMLDMSVVGSYPLAPDARPIGLDLDAVGNELAVAESGLNRVAFINLTNGTVSETGGLGNSVYGKAFDVLYGRPGVLYTLSDSGIHVINTTAIPPIEDLNQFAASNTYEKFGAITPDKNTLFFVTGSNSTGYCSVLKFDVSAGLSKPIQVGYTTLDNSGFKKNLRLSVVGDSTLLTSWGNIYNVSDLSVKAKNGQSLLPVTDLPGRSFYAVVSDVISNPDMVYFLDKEDSYKRSSLSTGVIGTPGAMATTGDGNTLFISSTGGMAKFDIGVTPPGMAIDLPQSLRQYRDFAFDMPRGFIYGTDVSNRIDVIDQNTGNVLNSYLLPNGANPIGIDLSPNGSELAIAVGGLEKILFLSAETGETVAHTLTQPRLIAPYDVIYGRGNRLYAVGYGGQPYDYLHIIDSSTHTWLNRSTHPNYPSGTELAITADKKYIFANEGRTSYVFDVQTDTLTARYKGSMGGAKFQFTIAPDGSKMFTIFGEVWNGDLKELRGSLEGGSGNLIKYISGQGAVVMAGQDTNGNVLRFISADSHRLLTTYRPTDLGTILELEIAPDGSQLIVNFSSGDILILDISTILPVPPSPPPTPALSTVQYEDLVVDEARGKLYGLNKTDSKIDVMNMSDMYVTNSYPLVYGALPTGIDLSPDGNELAVAQSGLNRVAFINLNDGTISEMPSPLSGYTATDFGMPYDVIYGRSGILYSLSDGGIQTINTTTHAEDKTQHVARLSNDKFGAISSDKNTLFFVAAGPIYKFDVSVGLTKPLQLSTRYMDDTSPKNNVRLSLADDSTLLTSWGNIYNTSFTIKAKNGQKLLPVIALSGRGFYAVASSNSEAVYFLDEETSHKLSYVNTSRTGMPGAMAVTGDGNLLFVSSTGGMTKFEIGITPPGTAISPPVSLQQYRDFAFDMVRAVIYGTDASGRVDVIDQNSSTVIDSYLLPNGANPIGIDLSPDGAELAVAMNGLESILFLNAETGNEIARVKPLNNTNLNLPYDVIYGRTGRLYAGANPADAGLDYIHVFDTTTHTWLAKSSEVMRTGAEFVRTTDGKYLYANQTSSPNNVYVFDVQTDTITTLYKGPHGFVSAKRFTIPPNGSKVFTSNGQVWSGDMQTQLGNLQGDPGTFIKFIPNRNLIALTNGNSIKFIDATSYQVVWTHFPGYFGEILEMEVAPDGSKLIASYPGGNIFIQNLSDFPPTPLPSSTPGPGPSPTPRPSSTPGPSPTPVPSSSTGSRRTYTASGGNSAPGTFLCDQSQSSCTNGSNFDADNAHRYAADTFVFYNTHHGRNSFDNRGGTINSTVDYGIGYQNAFWDGYQMVYGDGMAADDVVAHELTHGVTQYTSNLIYAYQPGAINESFSDLWGEFIDQTNNSGDDSISAKWWVGEDSILRSIRSMSNPPARSDPDKMSSLYYYTGSSDNGGVHTNSGVNNKAAYLMVEGGTFNGRTIIGIGLNKTAAVYYETQVRHLTMGANYNDLYYALLQACQNLIGGADGITQSDCNQVKTAAEAVEMVLVPSASPTVSSIVRANLNPTAATSVNFTVSFSEAVTGVSTSAPFNDFALTTTGVTGATITGVSGSGAIYTVTVNTGSGTGTIRLNVVDDDSIKNAANNPLGGVGTGNGNYTSGEVYTINRGVDVNVTIGGNSVGTYSLGLGERTSPRYGINGGPVHVVSTNGKPIITSQRAIYGSSFNSIVGYPGNQLTTEYWFTSLDDLGMITYLVIGNPSTTLTAHVDVYIAGNKMNPTPYAIAPGQRVFPRYGINGGPVQVVSDIPIFTSERTKYGNSFNEVLGYPANQLTTEYWFTSLDDLGMITYLVIGNPSTVDTALVDVYIAGNKMNTTPYSIVPGQRVFPRYGINGGPVQVVSTNGVPIFTSERTKYGNSFNEVLGYPGNKLAAEYWFTSLDDAGMITYLVIGNPSTTLTAHVDVYINGVKQNVTPYAIAPGQRVFPRYGVNSGAVRVVSDIPIFTSERTKYLSSFNEILGLPTNQLTTDYWFTSLDDLGMATELVIAAP